MTKHLQERRDNRWQEIVSIGSSIDWADTNAQLNASLVLEDLGPSLDGLPVSLDPFQLWRMAERAA